MHNILLHVFDGLLPLCDLLLLLLGLDSLDEVIAVTIDGTLSINLDLREGLLHRCLVAVGLEDVTNASEHRLGLFILRVHAHVVALVEHLTDVQVLDRLVHGDLFGLLLVLRTRR